MAFFVEAMGFSEAMVSATVTVCATAVAPGSRKIAVSTAVIAPKPGREAPSGLRVWSFGAVSVTIDAAKQIVRAHVDGRWAPVSLDQLLEMHEKKERAKSKTF